MRRSEFYADVLRKKDVLMQVGKHAVHVIDAKYLDLVTVTASTKQVTAVRGDGEVARVDACRLIAYLLVYRL